MPRLSLSYLSAGYLSLAEPLFSCEINFCGLFFGLSFPFRLRATFLELETDIFFVGQDEKRFEWPTLAGNESFKQIRFAVNEQFVHLFSLNRPLQNDFSRSEVARFLWAD